MCIEAINWAFFLWNQHKLSRFWTISCVLERLVPLTSMVHIANMQPMKMQFSVKLCLFNVHIRLNHDSNPTRYTFGAVFIVTIRCIEHCLFSVAVFINFSQFSYYMCVCNVFFIIRFDVGHKWYWHVWACGCMIILVYWYCITKCIVINQRLVFIFQDIRWIH